jgi:hypothetical protein
MGRINEYQRQSFESRLNPGNIAVAGQTAQAFSQMANSMSDVAFRAQKIQDDNYVAEKAQEMEEKTKDLFTQHQQAYGENPIKSFDKFKESYSTIRDEYVNNAPSMGARQRLSQASNVLETSMKGHIGRWEIEQVAKNGQAKAATGLEGVQVEALRSKNPEMLDMLSKKGEVFLGNLSQVAAPEVVAKARSDFQKNLALNSFEGMINGGDYGGASRLLESKKYDGLLGAEGIKHLQRKIQTERDQAVAKVANIEGLKWSNPYKYAQEIGDVKGLAPVNEADPTSFLQRQQYVDYFNDKYGTKMPLLSPYEVNEFAVKVSKGDPTNQAAVLANLSANMTPQQYNAFANQVFEKSPAMGAAMGLALENQKASEDIIRGHQLLAKKAIVLGPDNENAIRFEYEKSVSSAIPDPELRARAYQAVRAVSAARTMDTGDTSTVSTDAIQGAIADVLGNPVNINGRQTLSFRTPQGAFLEEDDFEDVFDDLTSEKIKVTHQGDYPRDISGAALPLDEIKSNFYLETVGDGMYFIKNTESQTYATNKEGKPFELNLKRIFTEANTPNEAPIMRPSNFRR